MKRVLIAGDSRNARVAGAIAGIKPGLEKIAEIIETDLAASPDLQSIEADLVCVFGGDGSILRAVQFLGENQLPIAGVNLGKLGFLAEFSEEELLQAVPKVLSGERMPSSRLMLDVRLIRDGQEICSWHALNEAALVRVYSVLQIVRLGLTVDGVEVSEIQGDGILTATPTGSLAYSLSAGGAIVVPGTEAICITPVNPHTVTSRPLVVGAGSVVDISILTRRNGMVVCVDGRQQSQVQDADVVRVKRSHRRCLLVENRNFFETLRAKFSWGGSPAYGQDSDSDTEM